MPRPAEASASIAEDAFEGTIIALLLIPTFQTIFLKMAGAFQTMPSAENAFIDPAGYALMMVGALGLFSIGLTIVSVVGSYVIAGIPGVVAYFVFDLLVAAILNSITIAALLFVVGIPTFAFLIWMNQRFRQPTYRRR
ncbi:hypothetical protein [Natrinema sp. 1APR25-10V2]|uniref:hypothetical protein n=1 Tax=Natrinema sp. 1APR25-10V2 TaxID=2951081 RepID=UPI00287715FF|nr:hypothetical protein [Natrinema sp. 1APR25-10V2]MDS0473790.1 hypothetical protein [Natrinema sp. 1APR25-10V2]